MPELREVLHIEAFFPSDKLLDTEILDTLVMLGLRRTLSFTGLLDCARSVSLFHDSKHPQTLSVARKLLACLDALALKLSPDDEESYSGRSCSTILHNSIEVDDIDYTEAQKVDENNLIDKPGLSPFLDDFVDDMPQEEFWSELKTIAWCPVCDDPPLEGLPWLKSNDQVAVPSIVRPKSQMWIVSHSMHILDCECCSMYLQSKLGWTTRPSINVLSTQLIELSMFFGRLKSTSSVQPEIEASLQKRIPSLYSKLQEYIGSNEFMALKSVLDGRTWVWIGDDFVSPKALAFDSPVKFTPYLYVVPSELSEFRDLLLELGVKLCFDIGDYLNVLHCLQCDLRGSPLSNDQLNFVHCVLEAISDCCSENSLFEASTAPLFIPDIFGVLRNVEDLVYNDAPWMDNDTRAGKYFIHPSISNDLANRLGVQSVRCLSLVEEEMIEDLPCMDYARIIELLATYGDNDLMLFDLLELADCCKAKKLHLIFDKREHPRQSLLQHNLGD